LDTERFAVRNFALLSRLLKKEGISSVDGICADFGTSQFQIHHKEGFSFQSSSPLDMRMSLAHQRLTAAQIINRASEKDLADIFFSLGGERYSRQIAHAIVQRRKEALLKTTADLAGLIEKVVPKHAQRTQKIHPATRVFQALRIYVNKELENIKSFLSAGLRVLSSGGRIVCISFHSLEDRLVKNFFKDHQDELTIITKKPVTASEEELMANPSSRSAKLRAAEKK